VSSTGGEKWPTMLHRMQGPLSRDGTFGTAAGASGSGLYDRASIYMQQRPHLLTETHVGKATPFSMFFPLNTLPTALRIVVAIALESKSTTCQYGQARKVLEVNRIVLCD